MINYEILRYTLVRQTLMFRSPLTHHFLYFIVIFWRLQWNHTLLDGKAKMLFGEMPSCGWSYRPYVWIVEYMFFDLKSPCLSGCHQNFSCLILFNTMGVSWWLAMHQTHTRFRFLTLSSLRSNGFWWIWDQFPCFASGVPLLCFRWCVIMKHKNSTIRGIFWELACWP